MPVQLGESQKNDARKKRWQPYDHFKADKN
jgi:hypothetical protein